MFRCISSTLRHTASWNPCKRSQCTVSFMAYPLTDWPVIPSNSTIADGWWNTWTGIDGPFFSSVLWHFLHNANSCLCLWPMENVERFNTAPHPRHLPILEKRPINTAYPLGVRLVQGARHDESDNLAALRWAIEPWVLLRRYLTCLNLIPGYVDSIECMVSCACRSVVMAAVLDMSPSHKYHFLVFLLRTGCHSIKYRIAGDFVLGGWTLICVLLG